MKSNKFLEKAISKFYENKDYEKLNKIVGRFYPLDTYNYIKNWKFSEKLNFIVILNEDNAGNIFKEFPLEEQAKILEKIDPQNEKIILNELYADEIVDIFEFLDDEKIEEILKIVDDETRKKINKVFVFHTNQAGYNMMLDFIYAKEQWSLKHARSEIKKQINNSDLEIYGNIFVVDDDFKFLGFIKIETFFFNNDTDKVSKHTNPLPALKTTDNISESEDIIADYEVSAAPVVDQDNKLVGIIEFEELIKQFEEIEESFLEASNVKSTDINYLDLKVTQLFKARIPWIIILLFVGTLTQILITAFMLIWENNGLYSTASGNAALAIPGIISLALTTALSVSSSITDTAGNSGSQVSATMLRAIAVGEVGENDYNKAISKEMRVSLLVASTSAIVAFFRIFLVWWIMGFLSYDVIDSNTLGNSHLWVWMWYVIIALISSVTFFIAVMIGTMIGTYLPIWAAKYKADGAVISGPVQTTIVDLIAFAIYLSITTAIFVPLANNGYFGEIAPPDNKLTPFVEFISNHIFYNNHQLF